MMSNAPAIDRAFAAFKAHFHSSPTLVARAPGRVNLIGEHLDYNGGDVLPFAINLDCIVAMGPGDTGVCEVLALDSGHGRATPAQMFELSLDQVEFGSAESLRTLTTPQHWTRYVVGVLVQMRPLLMTSLPTPSRPFTREGRVPAAFNMVIATDVPLGGGLSSSASLEVALARALVAWHGKSWDPHAAASACQRAEHEFAGVPCGIMDQLTSAAARAGHALRLDCSFRRAPEHIPMPPPEEAVVLVMDSGVRHALASSEFGVRVATCTRVAQRLGLEHLADLAPGDLSEAARLFDDADRRAARHVCTEQGRVQDAVEAMRRRDWAALGRKMLESHCSLRDDYRVSCPELDTIVEAAMAVPGVYGARMTGGGFGGCAIALAEPRATNELCRSVAGEFFRRFDRQPRVFQTVASDGASVVDPMPLP